MYTYICKYAYVYIQFNDLNPTKKSSAIFKLFLVLFCVINICSYACVYIYRYINVYMYIYT